ncbi:glycosyltransferase [Marinoscillum sp. MHG1-6]|uniref:glycosyltransferase n=1 Tax=Marinoscillum sp. MHG1-6 TaxID=2959627 RepID=UPI002157B757|nr:glycosyltransferase [Marinoscillum sp. MHG1-6]
MQLKALKIVFLVPTVDGYGAERSIAPVINSLSLNNELTLIVPGEGRLATIINLDRVKVIRLPLYHFVSSKNKPAWKVFVHSSIKRILTLLILTLNYNTLRSRGKYDLAYSNTFTPYLGLYLKRLGIAKRVVYHCREHFSEQFDWQLEIDIKRELISFDVLISNSVLTQNQFKDFPIKKEVLPNPILKEVICSNNCERKRNNRAIFIGRLDDSKQPLQAVKIIHNYNAVTGQDITLDIYGDGIQVDDVESIAAKFPGKVNLIGYHPIDSIEFDQYDFAILPYKFEAFGRIYIELLNNSIPIVSNRNGNAVNLITEGVNGAFYQDSDLKEAVRAIDLIYSRELFVKINGPDDTITRDTVAGFQYENVLRIYNQFFNQITSN